MMDYICFNCAHFKTVFYGRCEACGRLPIASAEIAVSIVTSRQICGLMQPLFLAAIAKCGPISVPPSTASQILRDLELTGDESARNRMISALIGCLSPAHVQAGEEAKQSIGKMIEGQIASAGQRDSTSANEQSQKPPQSHPPSPTSTTPSPVGPIAIINRGPFLGFGPIILLALGIPIGFSGSYGDCVARTAIAMAVVGGAMVITWHAALRRALDLFPAEAEMLRANGGVPTLFKALAVYLPIGFIGCGIVASVVFGIRAA